MDELIFFYIFFGILGIAFFSLWVTLRVIGVTRWAMLIVFVPFVGFLFGVWVGMKACDVLDWKGLRRLSALIPVIPSLTLAIRHTRLSGWQRVLVAAAGIGTVVIFSIAAAYPQQRQAFYQRLFLFLVIALVTLAMSGALWKWVRRGYDTESTVGAAGLKGA